MTREDAKTFMRKVWRETTKGSYAEEAYEMAIKALEQSTIEPQQWIPCNEKLPDNDDFVIVTILDEHGDTPYRYSDFGWYFDRAKCWIIDAEERTDVIAWMPLPTPYIVE